LKRQLKGWGQNGSSGPVSSLPGDDDDDYDYDDDDNDDYYDDDDGDGGGDASPSYMGTEWRILLLYLFTVNRISRNSAWRHALPSVEGKSDG
jgi:hypothetical protein